MTGASSWWIGPDAFAALVADPVAAAGDGRLLAVPVRGARPPRAATGGWPSDRAGAPSVDWSRSTSTMGDERCVPPDDPDSNHRMVAETLLDRVGPVRSDHPMYRSGRPTAPPPPTRRLLGRCPPSTWSTSGSGPTATPRRSSPDRPALASRRPGRAGGGQPRPAGQQPPRSDHPHLPRHRPGPAGGVHRRRRTKTRRPGPDRGRRGPARPPGSRRRGALVGRCRGRRRRRPRRPA